MQGKLEWTTIFRMAIVDSRKKNNVNKQKCEKNRKKSKKLKSSLIL